jgi:hypothetical protein
MVAEVRYEDAALAIHGNPDRGLELRCCTGAVSKPETSRPSENFHGPELPKRRVAFLAERGMSAFRLVLMTGTCEVPYKEICASSVSKFRIFFEKFFSRSKKKQKKSRTAGDGVVVLILMRTSYKVV